MISDGKDNAISALDAEAVDEVQKNTCMLCKVTTKKMGGSESRCRIISDGKDNAISALDAEEIDEVQKNTCIMQGNY